MFAPKAAKIPVKAAEGSTGKRMPQRLSNQQMPSRGGNESHASWNFSNIPVLSSEQSKRAELSSPVAAAPLPDPIQSNLAIGSGVNDSLEREANTIAERALSSGDSHSLLKQGASRAQLHTGRQAEVAAASLDAAAFTVGDNIFFGAGQYRPDTWPGRRLIAHEAVHVGQQARFGQQMVQRQPSGVVQMPPLEITSTLKPTERAVPHLDQLTNAGVTPQTPTIAHTDEDIQRNTPDPAATLPFTSNGWNGTEILNRLGQYDRMPGTDSDSIRCVQAVGMAAHVTDGPAAVTDYLGSLIMQGLLTGQMTSRKNTAIKVLKYVTGRIETQRATFGDLSWAQEAMHDLFYDDVSGTPLTDIPGQIKPGTDLTKNLQSMDVWCDTPQQVMDQAGRLQPGEQLVIEEWTVSLNTAFDDLNDQNIEVAEGHSIVVNINGRQVRIRRVPMDQRPAHTDLDFVRDRRSGHQLLIVKDSASGALRLYEPEITASGQHFEGLAADGSNLAGYFGDQPRFGIYHYIEIIGKLQPNSTASSAAQP